MWLLTELLKTETGTHIYSFVFHNEQKNLDISPSSSFQQQLIITEQEPLLHQTSQISHM